MVDSRYDTIATSNTTIFSSGALRRVGRMDQFEQIRAFNSEKATLHLFMFRSVAA